MPPSGSLPEGPGLPSPARKGSRVKRVLIFGVPLLVLGGLVFNRLRDVRAQQGQLQQQSAGRRNATPAVEVVAAGPKTIAATLDVVGDAESPNVARLAPKVAGPITFLEVREGDPVVAGQVLVRIDPREVEAGVNAAQASVSEARARLAQAQATASATLVGIEGTITGGQAGVAQAQAQLTQARSNQAAQIASAQAAVGDLTARIQAANAEVKSAQAEVVAAEANLNNARIRYDRTAELHRGGYIAAQDLDDARAQVRVQEGALGVAQATVRSRQETVAGLVAQRKAANAQVSIVRRETEAAIATANAAVRSARATLGTATANRAQGPAYQQNLAALRASVTAAESSLAQAQTRRTDTELRSPLNGTVTARAADPGSLASPGTPVVTVQASKPLFIQAAVPIEIGQAITPGSTARIVFDALPGRTIEGRIEGVNRAADPQNRRFSIRVRLENADEAVRPGMFARVTLVTRRTDAAVAVPLQAVKEDRGTATVTVIGEDNVAEQREVQLGARDGRFVEIRSGLRAGERVVTLSYNPVRDGQKVSIGRPEGRDSESGGRESDGQRRGGARGSQTPTSDSRTPTSGATR